LYLVFFALLSVAGAWIAWRRNPMYTAGKTLRFILVVGLAVAAVIGVVFATVNLTIHKSPAIALGSMFGVVIAGTIALIWVITKLSAPAEAAPPPSKTIVRFHRKRLDRWAWRAVWTVAVLAVIAVAAPDPYREVAFALGVLVALLGTTTLFAAYMASRNLDRSLTALQADAWVHWHYTAAQWAAWTGAQVAQQKAVPPTFVWRKNWPRLVIPLGAVSAGFAFFGTGSVRTKIIVIAILWALILAILLLSLRFEAKQADLLATRLKHAAPEVYIGENGIFAGGVYTQWVTIGNFLLEAGVDEKPPRSLVFLFNKVVPGGTKSIKIRQAVPIPDRAERDVTLLQRNLAAKFPKLPIRLC